MNNKYIGILTSGGCFGNERGYPCRDPRRHF